MSGRSKFVAEGGMVVQMMKGRGSRGRPALSERFGVAPNWILRLVKRWSRPGA
jgi:hypothetical protein